jgi:pyridinium-3,5-bisthiocarboxylic acid mononucleotide nickel chelatase
MIENDHVKLKIVYFDCYSGISGDMILGALLDSGLDLNSLCAMLDGLKLSGYRLEAEKVKRGGIAGTKANVVLDKQKQNERTLPAILNLIEKSGLPEKVKAQGSAIFQSLAEAEATVHGTTVDQVHFHEVGAVDAIVDIVGTAAALYLLNIEEIYCSPLPLSSGEVQTAHGLLPLPAPATLELLAKRKIPVRGSLADFELVTPTGAAIVTSIAKEFGPLPDFTAEAVGYGAGSHNPAYPNYLRLILGYRDVAASFYAEEVIQVQANIDDLNPELFGYLMEKLFADGALDVFFTPVQMKKDRPAVLLTALAPPHCLAAIRKIIFAETSTLGLRLTTARKIMLPRKTATFETEWGPVRIKYCPSESGGKPLHYAPEYDDCCKIARTSGLPLKEVYRIAESLFRNQS